MGLFDQYRIKKAVDTLSYGHFTSSEVAHAAEKLKQIGSSALPQLIEAFGPGRNHEIIVSVLSTMLQNDTLSVFIDKLINTSSRQIETGLIDALVRGDQYDPNKLLGLFGNPKVSKEHLEKVLLAHKHKLHPETLLRLLNRADKSEHEAIFRLIDEVATEATVPELINRLRTEDGSLRYKIARILCRFRTGAVQDALV
jgi:hypothetical protein